MKGQASLLAAALLASAALLLVGASSASALAYGLGWSGHPEQIAAEMDVVEHSGSSFFRMPIDISATGEVNPNWATTYDPMFKSAWEHGITILPILIRSNKEGTRFLASADAGYSNWNFWTIAAVERYGYNGTFWNGKINPRPVTTWEVWNEPNLPKNNPQRTQAQCEAHPNWTIFKDEAKNFINCTQPDVYGSFLAYTAASIQAASQKMAAVNTGVLFGGLAFPYGQPAGGFLSQAYAVSGVPSSFGGLSIHPYGFDFAHAAGSKTIDEMKSEVNAIRSTLSGLSGGAGKSLWITELGWPLNNFGDSKFPAVKDEAEQARLLNESITWIKGVAGEKLIETLVWYNIRDYTGGASWDFTCGLRDQWGNYRQQWWAFQQQTGKPKWPLMPPTVVTTDATSIQEKQGTINGTINPNGSQASYRFEYGTSAAYGTSIPVPNVAVGAGSSPVAVSATITNLQPNTRYHYRVVGTNPDGTTYGTDHAFTTGLKWLIRNSNSGGAPDSTFWSGLPGQVAVSGDWNGDGVDTPGTYEPLTGIWRLRNSNTSGGSDITPFSYGGSQYIPVVGDWNGDGKTTIGLYEKNAGTWSLRNSNTSGGADITPFSYGGSQFTPVVGDWNKDGKTTIGLYEPNAGTWSLRNTNTAGSPDIPVFSYGGLQFTPVVGDWDNDGTTTVGLFEKNAGTWALRNSNSAGGADIPVFSFGGSQFTPIVGDWDNKGGTSVGLIDASASVERNWLPRNSNEQGGADLNYWFGWPGQVAVSGDWNGDGVDTPGTYEPLTGIWRLRNSNTSGEADITPFSYGGSQYIPVVGDWNGDGKTTIGLYEKNAGTWSLRNSNTSGGADITPFSYGGSQFTPVVGDWNNDGKTTIGLYEKNAGTWSLRNSNTGGSPDIPTFSYGGSQYDPVTGDWNGDGKVTVALVTK